jgi:hypothetical protein
MRLNELPINIKNILIVLLLIAGFFVFSFQFLEIEPLSIIVAIFLLLTAVFFLSFLEFPLWMVAAFAISLGSLFGFLYGAVFLLIGFFFYNLAEFLRKKTLPSCPLLFSANDELLAAWLSFFACYPFYLFGFKPSFLFALPIFYGSIYFLLKTYLRSSSAVLLIQNEKPVLILSLPLISVISLAFYFGFKFLAFLLLAGFYPLKIYLARLYPFNPAEFVMKSAEYLATRVFGAQDCLTSFQSLAKAFAAAKGEDFDSKDLELVYFLSTLAWSSFSKMLYRQPEKLSAEELNLLSDNLVSLRELLNLAGFSPAITEAVYHLYEDYDGSGVPEGRKEGEIPLLSRLTRVLERYLLLTSWKENTEPLTDRDAIEEIRRQSGSLYDPRAVELLAQIILPGENFGEIDYEDKVNREMTVLEPGQAVQEEADINNNKASEGETVDRQ